MAIVILLTFSFQAGAAEPPTIKIPHLDKPPTLEDFLEMKPNAAMEGRMLKVTGFTQRGPDDGKPATQQTEVYLGYDDKDLYAVFVCLDPQPGQIRARLARRENVFEDDITGILLDTFHDRRHAYEFFTNPLGIQIDGITTEGQGDDYSFDTLWRSRGKLTPQGYLVWMAIPFKSMRFPSDGKQTWGVALFRNSPRTNEDSFWPYVTRKLEGFAQQFATLEGLENISPGRNLQFIPYGVFSSGRFLDTRSTPQFRTQNDLRAGMDAKVVLHDSLTLDVALNPDFSQVESDEPQVTINQRFEVFFPEKRPFFIENSGYFSTPINLFFSRRIADPEFGARLTGKIGPWAIGALGIDDRAPGKRVPDNDPAIGEHAKFGILRVNREFKNQSTLGVMFTDREFLGAYNRVGSVDGRWKMNKNWVSQFQAVTSADKATDGTYRAGPAYDAAISRNGRAANYFAEFTDYSKGFHTEPGFVSRVDLRSMVQNFNYTFHPAGKHLTEVGLHTFQGFNWDHQGFRLDWMTFNDFFWNFRRNTSIDFLWNFFREGIRPVDFPVLKQNVDFGRSNPGLAFNSDYFKWVGVSGLIRWGQRVNFVPPNGQAPFLANATAGNASLTLRPLGRLRIDNSYLFELFRDRGPGGHMVFNDHILRSKWNWQFNRELSLRAIFQYSSVLANPALTSLQTTKNFNADFLVTYFVHPGTAFYVGYNSNLQNIDRLLREDSNGNFLRPQNRFINDGKQFFVKASYLFRF